MKYKALLEKYIHFLVQQDEEYDITCIPNNDKEAPSFDFDKIFTKEEQKILINFKNKN